MSIRVKELFNSNDEILRFLEHVFDFNTWSSSKTVIASSGKYIYVSSDLGNSWSLVWPKQGVPNEILGLEPNDKNVFARCFTTSTGRHLMQLDSLIAPGGIYVFDNDWNYLGLKNVTKFNWLGTFSIGERNGIIMFAEYICLDFLYGDSEHYEDNLKILRSADDGDTWESVFSKRISTNLDNSEIRHFHTCFPYYDQIDQTNDKSWLISSGDTDKQSRVWMTNNNGDNWYEITDTDFTSQGEYSQSIHRYTAIQTCYDGTIIWVTDDFKNQHNSALMIHANIINNKLKIKKVTPVFSNNSRSLIDFGTHYLNICEAKYRDKEHANIQLFDKKYPNSLKWNSLIKTQYEGGFSRSLSSIAAYEGRAFSYNNLFTYKTQALQFDFHRGNIFTTRPEIPPLTCSICGEINTSEEKFAENLCSNCQAAPRIRTLPVIFKILKKSFIKYNLVENLPILAFSATDFERKEIKKVFKKIKLVALYGEPNNYDTTTLGVDIRDLSKYEDDKYSGIYSMVVFDYFSEHEQALKESYRVISPGGIFMTLITSNRLQSNDSTLIVTSRFHANDHRMSYIPRDVELCSVSLGKIWFMNLMDKVGFQSSYIDIYDEASKETNTWFIGIKSS